MFSWYLAYQDIDAHLQYIPEMLMRIFMSNLLLNDRI